MAERLMTEWNLELAPDGWWTTCWLGMKLTTPGDWEILGHSLKPDRGRLVYVDHRRQRMLLSWVAVNDLPDLKRVMSDYRAQALAIDADVTFADAAIPRDSGWIGHREFQADCLLTRATRYEPTRQRWVEMTLSWPHQPQDELELALLGSFSVQPEVGPQTWSAFGLNFQQPQDWHVTAATILPADVSFTLAPIDKPGKHACTIRRRSLLAGWFDGDLEKVARRDHTNRTFTAATEHVQGHPALRVTLAGERLRMAEWLRMAERFVTTALYWHCPACLAIYSLTLTTLRERVNVGPGQGERRVQTESFLLPCCGPGNPLRRAT